MTTTHDVFNQSTPFVDRNLYAVDAALQQAVARFGAGTFEAELTELEREFEHAAEELAGPCPSTRPHDRQAGRA